MHPLAVALCPFLGGRVYFIDMHRHAPHTYPPRHYDVVDMSYALAHLGHEGLDPISSKQLEHVVGTPDFLFGLLPHYCLRLGATKFAYSQETRLVLDVLRGEEGYYLDRRHTILGRHVLRLARIYLAVVEDACLRHVHPKKKMTDYPSWGVLEGARQARTADRLKSGGGYW